MQQAILENAGVSVMEASIIPAGLKIIDGQNGLPSLPDVAISIHRSNAHRAQVSLVADHLLAKLGGRLTAGESVKKTGA